MSRSRKRTPIHGIAVCESEKKDKRVRHSRMRSRERDRLITNPEGVSTHERDVSDPWGMAKDGKRYWPNCPDLMRK